MRLAGLCVCLAAITVACGAPKPSGPAWPAASTTADDGGESIEPRSTAVTAAVEKSADAKEDKPAKSAGDAGKLEVPAAAADDKPATVGPPQSAPVVDDVIMTDDMIIEIDEE